MLLFSQNDEKNVRSRGEAFKPEDSVPKVRHGGGSIVLRVFSFQQGKRVHIWTQLGVPTG